MENVVYLAQAVPNIQLDPRGLPIVSFGDLLTFMIRGVFIVAGLAALVYGLLGGLAWITSGGEKDSIQAARDKIQAAIVGVFILIIFLSIVWTLENVVFRRNICFGLSCPVTIPQLNITPLPTNGAFNNITPGTVNAIQASQTATIAALTLTPTPTDEQLPQTGGLGNL